MRLIEFTVGLEEREDGEVFVAQHAHYEDFAEALREMELEDDAFADYNNALTHLIGFCHSRKNVYLCSRNNIKECVLRI